MFKKLLLASVALLLSSVAFASEEDEHGENEHTVLGSFELHFPDKSVGAISLLHDSAKDYASLSTPLENTLWSGKAAGNVTIPKMSKTVVCLSLNDDVLSNPARLETISTKGIQALQLGILSMTDEETDITTVIARNFYGRNQIKRRMPVRDTIKAF